MVQSIYKLPRITLIACGGTIGGEWSPEKDTVVPSKRGNQRLREYLDHQARPHRKIDFIDLFNKDSRVITDKDRQRICDTIKRLRKKGVRHFIVTHGTFTMAQTGSYIEQYLQQHKVSDIFVILCGSMIPNSGFAPSDAQFNIGLALGKISMMHDREQTGAWVCMNALMAKPSVIEKNVKKARFETKKK
jgi:L-asparaginase/Glu-tRNA(Gln) amidotransferase subunit D